MSHPTAFTERAGGRRPLTWRSWLGIVLVPALIGGMLLWAFWRPTDHLDRVTAAIVNRDEPVKVQGQLAPLGRELAGALVDSPGSNLTWVLTDAGDAANGLKDARYAAVLTIPKDFSQAATSSSNPQSAAQAVLDLSSSADTALLDSALSKTVAQAATSVFNSTMAQTHIENVYLGFSTLHDKIGQAATGADKLVGGSNQLVSGLQQFSAGAKRLTTGTDQLAVGATGLATGIDRLGAGTGKLADGADQLAAGSGQVVAGMTRLGNGAAQLSRGNAELAAGVTRIGAGATELGTAGGALANGFTRSAAGLTGLGDASAQLKTGSASLVAGLDKLAAGTGGLPANARALAAGAGRVADASADLVAKLKAAGAVPAADVAELEALVAGARGVAAGNTKIAAGLDPIAVGAKESAAGARRLDTGLTQLTAGVPALTKGAAQLTTGANRFAAGAKQFSSRTGAATSGATELAAAARALSGGINQASGGIRATQAGARRLAGGIRALEGGTDQLAAGAQQLVGGIRAADNGTDQLASAAGKLSAGATQLDKGVDTLASGLRTAAKSVPSYTAGERRELAKVAATPVVTAGISDALNDHGTLGFLATLGLWAGALATYIVVAVVPRTVRTSRRTTAGLVGGNIARTSALAAIQATLLTALVWIVGDLSVGTGLLTWLALMLAGLTFLLFNASLVGLFGNFGRLLSATVLVITLVAGIWSGAPGAFSAVLPALPTDGALRVLRAVLADGQQATSGIFALVVWSLISAVALVLVTERRRTFRPGVRAPVITAPGAVSAATG